MFCERAYFSAGKRSSDFVFYFQVFYGHSFVSISLSCLLVYFGLFISSSSCCFFQFVIYNSRFTLFQSNHSLAHLFWVIGYLCIAPFSSSLNIGGAFKLWHFIFVFMAAAASAGHILSAALPLVKCKKKKNQKSCPQL